MKKLIPLYSALALTACGETDTREKHMYTVEVEVTDPNGKVQKVAEECKQLFNICQAKFDLDTASGKQTFMVRAYNKPVHEEEIYRKRQKVTSQQEEDRLTDSQYYQNVSILSHGLAHISDRSFKGIKIQNEKWTPRTDRVIQQALIIPDPDTIKKRKAIRLQMKDVESKRHFDRVAHDALTKELHSISIPDVKAADLTIRIY